MKHKSINLELRVDKPENLYRFIYAWRAIPSSHGSDIQYLLLHALVQWGTERDVPKNVFSLAMQYSSSPGQEIDQSQPAHIVEEDVEGVLAALSEFVAERREKR